MKQESPCISTGSINIIWVVPLNPPSLLTESTLMAINNGNENQNTQNAAPGKAAQDQNQQSGFSGRRRSFFEINRTHRRSISRSQLGEVVSRWREAAEAVIKNPAMNEN